MEDGTARASLEPDSDQQFVSLRRPLGVTTFGINQIALKPGQRLRIHRHQRQEEVYLVLEGRLTVAFEDEDAELGPGELLRVAPRIRRQLLNRSHERVIVIALGGDGDHQGRDGEAFTSWTQTTGAPPQEVPLPDDLPPSKLS
jgi:mannose-6-phosphate isomerase-like protein (cupin superfamily)